MNTRLTEKNIKSGIYYPLETEPTYDECKIICVQKLGKLEDIEDELGIDLITLFKALDLKQPIFVKDFQGACEFDDTIVSSKFITNGKQLALVDNLSQESMYLNLDEYGKTWALTKEELD